jgi:hypothetical protein
VDRSIQFGGNDFRTDASSRHLSEQFVLFRRPSALAVFWHLLMRGSFNSDAFYKMATKTKRPPEGGLSKAYQPRWLTAAEVREKAR